MAHLLTGDDKFRDGATMARCGTITGLPGTHVKRGNRMRSALRRVNGCLKTMIEAIADSKVRRMRRDLELRGIRFDPHGNNRVVRHSGPSGAFEMRSPVLISLSARVVRAVVTFLGPSWDGPVKRYRPEEHYMRGPGPKFREKHSLGRASPG